MPGEPLPPSACLLPAQKPMLVAELFFGRNIPGRAPVSEEPPKILLAAAYPRPDLKDRVAAVIEAYRARFPQKSVGLLTRWECGAF